MQCGLPHAVLLSLLSQTVSDLQFNLANQVPINANPACTLPSMRQDVQPSLCLQERCGSFMTAKGRLIEDMRKKGQTYRPSDHTASSSQNSGQPCQQKVPPFKKPAAAGQKRSGQCLSWQGSLFRALLLCVALFLIYPFLLGLCMYGSMTVYSRQHSAFMPVVCSRFSEYCTV